MNKKVIAGSVVGLIAVSLGAYVFLVHLPAIARQDAAYTQLENLQMEYAANKVIADGLPALADDVAKVQTEQAAAVDMFAFDGAKFKEKLEVLSKEKNLSLKSIEIGERRALNFSEEKGFEDSAEGQFYGQEIRISISGAAKGFQTAITGWAAALEAVATWKELKIEPGPKDKKGKQDIQASAILWVFSSESTNLDQALAIAKEYSQKAPPALTPFPKPSSLMPKPAAIEEEFQRVQADAVRLKTTINYVQQLKTEKLRLEQLPTALKWLTTQGEGSKQNFQDKLAAWGKKKPENLTIAF